MREPFPRSLRWALLGPFAVFAATYLLAMAAKGGPESKVLNGVWLLLTGAAALVEIVAVPTAIFLLIRDAPRYTTLGNILMTLASALPILVILLLVLLFSGALGTFHI
jgi:hypothetical protein